MVRRLAALGLAAGLAAAPAPAPAHVLFRLSDARLTEASGIALGIRSPGVLYAQNDGGDTARFFALDRRTGRTLAAVRVRGARNVDWEDLAVAPDRRGVPSVWIADIGDNGGSRAEVQLYRVDEPRIGVGGPPTVVTGPVDVWRLRYPSGRPDAESLAVSPKGQPFVVTKDITGSSTVYAVPPRPGPAVQRLLPVAKIRFPFTGTGGGPAGPVGNLTATGAALSAGGRTLVVRTYTDAYFWPVPPGGVAAALRLAPVRIPLPAQPQGEGIAFVGSRVVIDSEGRRSPVWSVPIPSLRRRTAAASPSTTPAASAAVGTASAAASPAASRSAAAPVAAVAGVGTASVLGLGVVLWLLGRRRQQRR